MRDLVYTPSDSRIVSARAEVFREIPVFESAVLAETNNHEDPIQSYTAYDADDSSYGIFRVAVINGGYLAYQMLDNLDIPPDWVVTGIAVIGRPGVFHNYVYFQTPDFKVYRRRWLLGGTFEAAVELPITTTYTLSFAPVAIDKFYYQYIETPGVKRIGLFYDDETYLWDGSVYGEDLDNDRFDAITHSGIDYIYTTETKSGRIVYLTNNNNILAPENNNIFSELKYVFALDVVDDTSMYRLECAKVINGKAVIVCQIKRTNGPSMTAYSFGPDEWSLGREMYITSELITYYGCIHDYDDKIIYMYPGKMHYTDDADIFGLPNSANKTSINNIKGFSYEKSEGSSSVSMSYPSSISGVTPGSRIVLYATINGTEYTLFTGDVDVVTQSTTSSGSDNSLHSRGKATKKLGQWQSDVSYDWWSQTKHNVTELDYSGLTRVQGTWEFEDGVARQTDPGRDGYLQLPAKACKDGQIKARFKLISEEYSAFYGVGLHFYQLNIDELKDILGEEFTQDRADIVRPNCMLALYGPNVHEDAPGIGLYKVRAGSLIKITSVAHEFTYNIPHWLMLTSRDGNLRVDYAADNAGFVGDTVPGTWTNVIDYTYVEDEDLWKSGNNDDHVGRGVIFASSGNPQFAHHAFGSTDMTLPMAESHEGLPDSGVIIVDSEIMAYSTKSVYSDVYGPVDAGKKIGLYIDNSADYQGIVTFSQYRTKNLVLQDIGFPRIGSFTSVSVYVKKIGDPTDGLVVQHHSGDRSSSVPLGTLLERAVIPASEIGTELGWVTATFSGTVKCGLKDSIVLVREASPEYPDDENYFAVGVNTGYEDWNPYIADVLYTFNEQTDVFTNTGKDMMMKVYGHPFYSNALVTYGYAEMPDFFSELIYDEDYPLGHAYSNIFMNCVGVVTAGTGEGRWIKITDAHYVVVDPTDPIQEGDMIYYGYDETNAGSVWDSANFIGAYLGIDSELTIFPSLTLSARGIENTVASSHSAGYLSIYSEPAVSVYRVLYGSSDEDMTAGDVTRKIAAKAGISVDSRLRYGSTLTVSNNFAYEAIKKNMIVRYTGIEDPCGVYFSSDVAHSLFYYLLIDGTAVKLYHYQEGIGSTLVESYDAGFDLINCTISIQSNVASIWSRDRLIYTFYIKTLLGTYCGLYAPSSTELGVEWEEADTFVDNFILDMGASALSSINSLLQEKKIFTLDRYDGYLKIFSSYTDGPVSLNKIYNKTITDNDGLVASRIRVEGGDIYELIDEIIMAKYGNIFRMVNSRETYDLDDTRQFAEATSYEIGSMSKYTDLSCSFDPRLEPYDIITVDGSDLIIESVNASFSSDYDSVDFKMSMRCRWPATELT